MDIATVRQYLAQPPRSLATEVLHDACLHGVPGARAIVELCINLRGNRRTRRTFREVCDAFAEDTPPRWYGVLRGHVWSMYRLFLVNCRLRPW